MSTKSSASGAPEEKWGQNIAVAASAALLNEWESLTSCFPAEWQRRLRPPLFSFKARMDGWGCWHGGEKRLLEINLSLLLQHSWQAVLEVLRHEVAHQVVSECFPEVQESPHGQKFREVCRAIGANPAASGTYPTLDQRMQADENESLSEEARLTSKVQKLLALSKSANENEARQALLKARELTAKYSLSLPEDGKREEEFVAWAVGQPVARKESHLLILANILQEFYQVAVVWMQEPDFLMQRQRYAMVVHGACGKVKIASYVYDCLLRQIDSSWEQLPWQVKAANPGARGRKEFAEGLLRGFRDALRQQNDSPEVQALVQSGRDQQERLQEYLRCLYPRLVKFSRQRRTWDPALQAAGQAEGKKLILHPGLDRREKQRKYLPE